MLRYDERGVGGSTGDFSEAGFEDFAADALAGVAYLKTRQEIDAGKIGLIGHSEGAHHAAIAATRSQHVAFLILLAPGGQSFAESIPMQMETILSVEGASPELAARMRALVDRILTAMASAEDDGIAAQRLRAMTEGFSVSPEEVPEGMVREMVSGDMVYQRLRIFLDPAMRSLLSFDPADVLQQITVPVLAVTGEKDTQVPPRPNLALVEEAFLQGGNEDYTVLELSGLNHLFQPAETGSPLEYNKISVTFAPEALKVIGDWILERTRS